MGLRQRMLWETVRRVLRWGSFLGAIAHLAVSPPAGAAQTTFLEAHFDGVGGVAGLRGARTVSVSPDGANVYVVGQTGVGGDSHPGSLATFSRDPATGALTFVDALFDGVDVDNGLEGVFGNHAIALSPDGANVYVAASTSDSVAVFDRDLATGLLSFSQVLRQEGAGDPGLAGAWGVTVSRDGAHVYVAAFLSQAIAVFDREPATGALSFVDAAFNNQGGVVGLDDP